MNQVHIFCTWLMYFYIYSFIGWVWESCYVSVLHRKWVNRGFCRGPLLPLYGCGAVVMLLISRPFSQSLFLVYLSGAAGATVLEYITGVLMETLFKVRYWDYSDQKFNLNGHICLSSTLIWGVFTVLLTRFIHPAVVSLLSPVPPSACSLAALLITAGFCYDFSMAFRNALQFRALLEKLSAIRSDMAEFSDRIEAALTENLSQAKTTLSEGFDKACASQFLKEFSEKKAAAANAIQRYRHSLTATDRSKTIQQTTSLLSLLERIPPALRSSVEAKAPHIPDRIVQWKEQLSRLSASMTERQKKLLKNHSHIVSKEYNEELDYFRVHLFDPKRKK